MQKLIFIFLFTFICSHISLAQATANFTASATIIQPISISTTANINFANIDAKTGGAVILTPDNTRISAGGVVLAGEENFSAAAFIVKGQPGHTYDISLPDNNYSLSNGVENMIINNFTSNSTSGVLADGSQIIRVGATLNVNPDQKPGFYTTPESLHVTVNYN